MRVRVRAREGRAGVRGEGGEDVGMVSWTVSGASGSFLCTEQDDALAAPASTANMGGGGGARGGDFRTGGGWLVRQQGKG